MESRVKLLAALLFIAGCGDGIRVENSVAGESGSESVSEQPVPPEERELADCVEFIETAAGLLCLFSDGEARLVSGDGLE